MLIYKGCVIKQGDLQMPKKRKKQTRAQNIRERIKLNWKEDVGF